MYQFFLFGRFEARWNNTSVTGLESRKVQELFCYLATYRRRPHAREIIADLIWEGYPPASSRKNMRQTLWQLQSALNAAPADNPVLLVDGDFLHLNPDADVEIDLAIFEAAIHTVRNVEGHDLTAAQAATLQQAVELYRADFLEGWYLDWCLYERERYQNLFLMMLDKLVGYHEAQQQYETAIYYCNRSLREEYVRECTHRQLMRLYYLNGDRTAALRQFERCQTALIEELNVTPDRLTMQLYNFICHDDVSAITFPAMAAKAINADGDELKDVLDCLADVKAMLEGVQLQMLHRLDHHAS